VAAWATWTSDRTPIAIGGRGGRRRPPLFSSPRTVGCAAMDGSAGVSALCDRDALIGAFAFQLPDEPTLTDRADTATWRNRSRLPALGTDASLSYITYTRCAVSVVPHVVRDQHRLHVGSRCKSATRSRICVWIAGADCRQSPSRSLRAGSCRRTAGGETALIRWSGAGGPT
jgi:hypothetical protein